MNELTNIQLDQRERSRQTKKTIKFRGKSIREKRWIFGDLFRIDLDGGVGIQSYDEKNGWMYDVVNEKTVGQFTGVTDINGREIYEGDIVRVRVTNERFKKNPRFSNGVVTFCNHDGGWTNGCYFRFLPRRMEVIGNIHDNPELMKGGAQ